MFDILRKLFAKRKRADLERAITIAHEDILYEAVSLQLVTDQAIALHHGPWPYPTTHDLAVSTALFFYRRPEFFEDLEPFQLEARLRILNWFKAGKISQMVAASFEQSLYDRFHPDKERRVTTPARPPD